MERGDVVRAWDGPTSPPTVAVDEGVG